ncbi:Extracellular matrix protein fras1 [Mactra antiquata]
MCYVCLYSDNTGPPMFKVLNHVKVTDGDIIPLHLGLFYISDPDTVTENLYITLSVPPGNGDIIVAVDGKDIEVKVGENITVSDLIEGKVRFRHRVGQSIKGI